MGFEEEECYAPTPQAVLKLPVSPVPTMHHEGQQPTSNLLPADSTFTFF